MPTISQFFGIVIQMFWREHAPPHFHALYGEYEALIDIRTLEIIKATCPGGPWHWCWNGRRSIAAN
jgi:hypothetical protein